jgi:hypothetical protein
MPLHELEEDDGEDGDEEEEEEVEDNADPSEHLKYGLAKKTYPGRSESPGYKFGYGYRHSFPRPTGSPGSPIPSPVEDNFTTLPTHTVVFRALLPLRNTAALDLRHSEVAPPAPHHRLSMYTRLCRLPNHNHRTQVHLDGELFRGHVSMPSGDNNE